MQILIKIFIFIFILIKMFIDVILVSNYHGCQREVIRLIPYDTIDIIYKAVKSSHWKKLQIIQDTNNLMFQVIFIFSE